MSRDSYINKHQWTHTLPRFYAGRLIFVDSTYGDNSKEGNRIEEPLKSITAAITRCVADRDDLIIVLNGYDNTNTVNETLGDDTPITLDVAGVTILFQGKNNTVQAQGSGDQIFKITEDDCTVGVMPGGQIWVAVALAGTTSSIVEFVGAADGECFGFMSNVLGNYDELITADATSHRVYIHDNWFLGDTTDTDEGIEIKGTCQGARIERNTLSECCAGSGNISIAAAAVMSLVKDNITLTEVASKYGIKCHASATGLGIRNMSLAETSHGGKGVTGAKFGWCENYNTVALSLSAQILPAI